MVLAGLALGGLVVLSWPEQATHVVRLPYGESSPKTPEGVRAQRVIDATAPAGGVPAASAAGSAEGSEEGAPVAEEAGRALAAVEPGTTPRGPGPVRSQLELEPGYVQESPEALGAEPLPGAVVTPGPPPVAR